MELSVAPAPDQTTPGQDVASPPPPVKGGPVMDIIPPRAAVAPRSMPGAPVESVPAPRQANQATHAVAQPKPPKAPSNGIAGAIVATVIIIVLLAGMAVYAYLQS